jgi:NAD-dependent SIR2 family protein deacetylase
MQPNWEEIAEIVTSADAMVIGAGAGMGVDSGLPDFRGDEGFWNAYPPFRKAGHSFVDMANPRWFEEEPELAWGFYGHRLHLYRDVEPHAGFRVLRELAGDMEHGAFIYTSNVDGQFQKAGFGEDQVVECHGSLMHLQCSKPCSDHVWSAEGTDVEVDMDTIRATSELPRCHHCGAVSRPAILMFGDWCWNSTRTDKQADRYQQWLDKVGSDEIVVIESGAGTAVPTVRRHCERLARHPNVTLIRINPRESHGPSGTVSVPMGAESALAELRGAV